VHSHCKSRGQVGIMERKEMQVCNKVDVLFMCVMILVVEFEVLRSFHEKGGREERES